ncbi:M48 family metalloprotease [Pseudonocardia alaniniphila]|uniref:M48 family metalloprotease n=1 Tax=Pseudonocardia alaniniphila TaxID=75291 RepID=A0ABS9T6C0_9PSEU|nr:M48 family metalloprotease [Pseudonocardia alaniniphila]MCH6164071.1 M48 family metalloprotease [Pseudonocardia alaniniphila]
MDDPAEPAAGVHALGSGTGLRFVLLVVLVAASTVAMMRTHIVLLHFLGDPNNDIAGCNIAAGFDPGGSFMGNLSAVGGRNSAALNACTERYGMAWWAPIGAVGGVFLLAAVLCWVTPLWRIRRRGLRPVDPSSEAGQALRTLAARADVPSACFVADWASGSMNAVAFGRPGNMYVSLPGGLLLTRTTDPGRFAAIVLHELAHLRYRDVGITYATIALWRVFALTMLLPSLARYVELFVTSRFFLTDSPNHIYLASSGPDYARSMALYLFTALLVYLSRSDILRTRELYADRRAVDWGASRSVWDEAGRDPHDVPRSRRPVISAVAALVATHPSWAHRAQALRDPQHLFRVPALPTFLTGATAALIAGHLQYGSEVATSPLVAHGTAALAGALLAGTTCLTLWRRAAHAVAAGRRTPSGVRAGIWLGAGVATGTLFIGTALERGHWLPTAPWFALLMGVVAAVVTCWTAQCARLLITAVPTRSVRPPAAVGLLATAGVFAYWLTSWNAPSLFRPDVVAHAALRPGGVVVGESSLVTVIMSSLAVATMELGPLLVWSTTALWLVPLTAWIGPTAGSWLVRSGLPSLWRMLAAGTAAGLLSAGLAIATLLVPLGSRDISSAMTYLATVLAALLVGPLGAAALSAAVRPRDGVLVGVIVAGTACLVGSVGIILLTFGLGCLAQQPDAGTIASCVQVVTGTWPVVGSVILMATGLGVFAAAAVALVVSGIAAAVRRLLRRTDQSVVVTGRERSPSTVLVIRRAVVVSTVVIALGLNALTGTSMIGAYVPSTSATTDGPGSASALAPTTQQARRAQVVAWIRYGGNDLRIRLADSFKELGNGLGLIRDDEVAGLLAIRSGCAAIGRWATDARAYFTIPDPDQQALWEQAQSLAEQASAACLSAVDARDPDGLEAAIRQVNEAGEIAGSVIRWISAQLR